MGLNKKLAKRIGLSAAAAQAIDAHDKKQSFFKKMTKKIKGVTGANGKNRKR